MLMHAQLSIAHSRSPEFKYICLYVCMNVYDVVVYFVCAMWNKITIKKHLLAVHRFGLYVLFISMVMLLFCFAVFVSSSSSLSLCSSLLSRLCFSHSVLTIKFYFFSGLNIVVVYFVVALVFLFFFIIIFLYTFFFEKCSCTFYSRKCLFFFVCYWSARRVYPTQYLSLVVLDFV